jgi:hypothetical protein
MSHSTFQFAQREENKAAHIMDWLSINNQGVETVAPRRHHLNATFWMPMFATRLTPENRINLDRYITLLSKTSFLNLLLHEYTFIAWATSVDPDQLANHAV